MTTIPASKQWWYTAPDQQFALDPLHHVGPTLPDGTAFLFVDFAGGKLSESAPVGSMVFNEIGKAFMYGDDDGEWFRRYLADIGEWMGASVLPIFRYATGAYGSKMPDGRIHKALRAMMSTAWLHGPNAQHNAFCMMRIADVCGRFGVYHGTPAYDENGVAKVDDVTAVVRAWNRLGACWQGFDYISGYDSTGGEPADRAFPSPSQFWPYGSGARTGFERGPRQKLWADKFMLDMHAAAPTTPMCAESGLDPGRAMYERVGMLRMIVPNSIDDDGARYGLKSTERLTGEARDYEVCNPGVPQYNLFDAGEHWTPDEYAAMVRVVESLPGNQILGATCWVPGTAGGPNIHDYYRDVPLYTDAKGGG